MISKTGLLLGLLASCYAAPIKVPTAGAGALERRIPGHIPTSVDCGGVMILKVRIKEALEASRTGDTIGGYPKNFYNKDEDKMVFDDATIIREAKISKIREYPIELRGTFRGGPAGLYRVIFRPDPESLEARYCGVMFHNPDNDGRLEKCTEVPTPPPSPKIPPSKGSGSSKKTPAPMPDLPDPERPYKGPPGVKPKKGGKPKGGKSKNGGGA